MVRIVHLSDLHFSAESQKDFETYVMKALVEDLKKYHEERCIDLVIISGDLIDKGGAGFQDIDTAFLTFEEVFINTLKKELGLTNNNFVFAPGNHEVDRNKVNNIHEMGLVQYFVAPDIINKYIDEHSDLKCNDEGISRIKSYKEFEDYFFSDNCELYVASNFQSVFCKQIDGVRIGVCTLNSAWRCSDSNTDKKKLIVGERQITEAMNHIKDCDLKIAVMHHPIDWLSDIDEKTIRAFLSRDFNMVFCGHVHEGTTWARTDMYGNIIVSVAPSNWTHFLRSTDRDYANGYFIVDYNRENVDIYSRRYSFLKGEYVCNNDEGQDGKISYPIKCSEEIMMQKRRIDLADKIEDIYLDDRNGHLISFYTDTSAPKEIENIFVLPKLVNKLDYDVQKAKSIKHYTLEDICNYDKNLIVYGTKETGKTVLLDRILIEFTHNIEKYNIIPVFIDFQEYIANRFETAIARFLGVGIKEVMELIKTNKIVLLVDNLSFNKKNQYKIKDLETMLENSNIRMIATVTTTVEGEVPIDILEYPTFTKCESIILQCFKTKEIKELMKKWFSQNPSKVDQSEYYDRLIKVFYMYNLPSTPLAVSMFLWIIEQQENYQPINNAAMLENFIERLFKKSAKKVVLSSSFDYTNKERLLSEIAYRMLSGCQDNYAIELNELRTFTNDYLKARMFDFDEDDILKEFFSNGILLKDHIDGTNIVRFRFNCFFQYYLMKRMEFNKEFKEYVLKEENYLNFVDEIDYYTALKRGEEDILKLVYNRMVEKYEPLIEIIEKQPLGFDSTFETSSSIASKYDGSLASEIKHISKPTEKDIEEINDDVLDGIKPENGIEKKGELGTLEMLSNLWMLAAKVLKNTEEISVEASTSIKSDCYNNLLKCCMAFSSLYKTMLSDYLKKASDRNEEVNEQMVISNRIMPMLYQLLLHSMIATGKLSLVIKEKIESDIDDPNISDYEKFLSVFIYADIKGKDYPKYIREFVKRMKRNYIYDMTFLKIITYYMLRSKSSDEDNLYLNLIAETQIKLRGESRKEKYQHIAKYKYMKLVEAKRIKSSYPEN